MGKGVVVARFGPGGVSVNDGPVDDVTGDGDRVFDPNRLITVRECAALTGMSSSAFRARVSTGAAPAPDEPDLDRAPQRREPKWRAGAIVAWQQTRPRRKGRSG